jgi:hypothetical protein
MPVCIGINVILPLNNSDAFNDAVSSFDVHKYRLSPRFNKWLNASFLVFGIGMMLNPLLVR